MSGTRTLHPDYIRDRGTVTSAHATRRHDMDVQPPSIRARILFGIVLIVASPFLFGLTYTLGDNFPTGDNYIDHVQKTAMVFTLVALWIGGIAAFAGGLVLIGDAIQEWLED